MILEASSLAFHFTASHWDADMIMYWNNSNLLDNLDKQLRVLNFDFSWFDIFVSFRYSWNVTFCRYGIGTTRTVCWTQLTNQILAPWGVIQCHPVLNLAYCNVHVPGIWFEAGATPYTYSVWCQRWIQMAICTKTHKAPLFIKCSFWNEWYRIMISANLHVINREMLYTRVLSLLQWEGTTRGCGKMRSFK